MIDPSAFRKLSSVAEWEKNFACVPTALSAVSGGEIVPVLVALSRVTGSAAQADASYDINHWLKAIHLLGGQYRPAAADAPLVAIPSIEQWMALREPTLSLAFCVAEGWDTHVFAAKAGDWVDPWTQGRVQPFEGLPSNYPPYLVKYVFEVAPASA